MAVLYNSVYFSLTILLLYARANDQKSWACFEKSVFEILRVDYIASLLAYVRMNEQTAKMVVFFGLGKRPNLCPLGH